MLPRSSNADYRLGANVKDQTMSPTSLGAGLSTIAVYSDHLPQLSAWISGLRLHHWSKNVLIFMPLLLSHQFQPWRVLVSLQAFFAFCFCASAFYVFNDLLDKDADRIHPCKAIRPFASGRLSSKHGLLLLTVCLLISVVLAWRLPSSAVLLLIVYAVTNVSYSVGLKKIAFFDVVVLVFLYICRLLFGGAAERIEVSFWTLLFSLFLFLGLAFLKRWTELQRTTEGHSIRLAGRGYISSQITAVRFLSQSSLYLSVAVLILYVNSAAAMTLYRHSWLLWVVCMLLFIWIRRVTLVTTRGLMTEDPLLFAFSDRGSQVIGALVILTTALAVGF
jgi:4-hydroxybenzoate polyprenyltransferase